MSALVAFVALAQHIAPASAGIKPEPRPTCPPPVVTLTGTQSSVMICPQ